LERDLEECVTYLRFPEAHHQRIRTTNRLERLNGARRTKMIPRVSNRTLVPDVAVRDVDGGVDALARRADDAGDDAAA
jgi:hypothetical protein